MQSKKDSLIEALSNTALGFITSYIVMLWLNNLYQMNLNYTTSLQVVMIFTITSVLRNYTVRRFFTRVVK